MEEIGKAIRAARKRTGMNQSDLAKRMDVTQTAITHWETGAHTPTVQKLVEVAKNLECSFGDLVADINQNELVAEYLLTIPKGRNQPEICRVKPKKIKTKATFSMPVRVVLLEGVGAIHQLADDGWALIFEEKMCPVSDILGTRIPVLAEFENGEMTFGRLLSGQNGMYSAWDRITGDYIEPRELRSVHRGVAFVELNT